MFSTVLIANRGEIALRIANTLQDNGVEAIVTSSPVDLQSIFVKQADGYVLLPGNAPAESYLNQDFIIQSAIDREIEAIHPGYGFLSESIEFRKKVKRAGITFIGPGFKAMEIVGDKIKAKLAAEKSGVPLLPGTNTEMSVEELKEESVKIGYPILIKATSGGGGKGIRLVLELSDFENQARIAMKEAKLAFNDDRIYIEKYLSSARHVEVQVLGLGPGEVVHFYERDCTLQRKKQKLVEEAPAPFISKKLLHKIRTAAVDLAIEVGYENAGTVEFLIDEKNNFYFMEVNARIQVEHPVTEMVTGEDLVLRQLEIASGLQPELSQSDIKLRGHAIEVRVNAENPFNGFTPTDGVIEEVQHPIGKNVRVDSQIGNGSYIAPYYDSLISKVITSGRDRKQACFRMVRSLGNYHIAGIHSTIPFTRMLLQTKDFSEFKYDINYIDKSLSQNKYSIPSAYELIARAFATKLIAEKTIECGERHNESIWKRSLLPENRW